MTPTRDVGLRGIDHLFSHACNNHDGSNGKGIDGCVNGLEHGRFATKVEKELHKLCTNGDSTMCPGHESSPVKCIFRTSKSTKALQVTVWLRGNELNPRILVARK